MSSTHPILWVKKLGRVQLFVPIKRVCEFGQRESIMMVASSLAVKVSVVDTVENELWSIQSCPGGQEVE